MKKNRKLLIPISSGIDICQKKFGEKAFILSNLGKIGYPVVDGFFVSSDILKQIDRGRESPEFPNNFLENGPFCLRSSPNSKELAGPEAFLYLGLNREKADELSKKIGKKFSNLLYINHIKNFGIRVFDLEADFFENKILKTLETKHVHSLNNLDIKSLNFLIT